MATPPHLETLSPGSSDADALFTPFPRLPAELRLRIWEFSLQRRRIFQVDVKLPRHRPRTHPYQSRNSLGNVISNTGYKPTVHAWSLLHHPLLQVNLEARTAALAFYRIHFPCQVPRQVRLFQTKGLAKEETVPSTLYFNPTYDILFFSFSHLASGNGSGNNSNINTTPDLRFSDVLEYADRVTLASIKYSTTVCAMLHDMQAYDPLGVGVQNLGFDKDSMRQFATEFPRKEDVVDEEDVVMKRGYQAVLKCLGGLQEVFWLAHKDAEVSIKRERPEWRGWLGMMLEFYGIRYTTPPKEYMLKATDLPEWEQELHRAMKGRESEVPHVCGLPSGST